MAARKCHVMQRKDQELARVAVVFGVDQEPQSRAHNVAGRAGVNGKMPDEECLVTFEEFVSFHQQWAASMEHNVGALVEAQQRAEERMDRANERMDRTDHQIGELRQAVVALGRVVDGLGRVTDRNLGMLEQLTLRMDEMSARVGQLAAHGEQTDRRLDRLTETLQQFLDSQVRRNGGN